MNIGTSGRLSLAGFSGPGRITLGAHLGGIMGGGLLPESLDRLPLALVLVAFPKSKKIVPIIDVYVFRLSRGLARARAAR